MSSQRVIRRLAPGLVAAAALLAVPAPSLAAPRNDNFENATVLNVFDVDDAANRTNVDATEQPPDEPLTCGGRTFANTVWYRIHGYGGPLTVETRGSQIDTVLAVYNTNGTDNGPPATTNRIGCDDNIPGDGFDPRASELAFPSEEGADYLVQIGSCTGSGCDTARPAEGRVDFIAYDEPPNNDRANATALTAGAPISADNIGATVQGGERTSCGDAPFAKTVWFRYTAPGPGTAVFSASGSAFDSVLTVYSGATPVGCNDDGAGDPGPSRLGVPVAAGEYFVQVGGYGTGAAAEFNDFTAQVEFTPAAAPDRDGDGIPDAADHCPDQNARARDANGDGCLDPLPPPPLKTLRSTVTSKFAAFRRYTKVSALVVNNLPAGSRVKVTCRSKLRKRCPKKRTVNVRTARRRLNLGRRFRGRRLPVGTVLTVQITAPGYVGKVIRYRMRKRRLPRTTQLCLPPGATRPGACD